MWIMKPARVRVTLLGLLIVVLAVLMTACGGSSTSTTAAPTTSTAPPTTSGASTTTSAGSAVLTGDAATIAANFVKFFDGTQPAADKVALLENGQQYTKELDAQAASPLAKMAIGRRLRGDDNLAHHGGRHLLDPRRGHAGPPQPARQGGTAGWRVESQRRQLPGVAGSAGGHHALILGLASPAD